MKIPTVATTEKTNAIGRYAPSPTGELHLGNLRTALLSWLQMRLLGGQFLIRMDDLDLPRVVKGSANQILRDLECLGLNWDGQVVYQSQRTDSYQQSLYALQSKGLIYPCFCSRKDIQQAVSAPHGQVAVYPKTCATLSEEKTAELKEKKQSALRFKVSDTLIEFNDGCLGQQQQCLQTQCGDFVVKRADGLFAYQLATVADDIEQNITHVLRGADLIDSTARQIELTNALNASNKVYYSHVPLMLDKQGRRMAKRDGSASINDWQNSGKNAEELVAFLANSIGLLSDVEKSISANELLAHLSYAEFESAISA